MGRLANKNHPHMGLLDQAVEALAGYGIEAGEVILRSEGGADVTFPRLGRYQAVFQTHLTPKRAGAIAERLKSQKQPILLIADYITEATAEALRNHQLQFVDTVGNVFLHKSRPWIYIWVQGKKPGRGRRHVPGRAPGPALAFREKGLRVIFPLLCLGETALNAPYRQIAHWAGVSLGTVANTIDDLTHLGYLRKAHKGLILENRDKLIDRWVEEYPVELHPKLNPRRYRLQNLKMNLYKYFITEPGIYMGGEVAAAILTEYLIPETAVIYGRPDFKKVIPKTGHIALDEAGSLEVLDCFWNFEVEPLIHTHKQLCPALLIYAALMASGEARQMEAAELIRTQYGF